MAHTERVMINGVLTDIQKLDHSAQQVDDAVSRALPGGAIDAGLARIPGRNLLDNWDFRSPVNQRGQQSYQSAGYTIDRWFSDAGGNTVRVNGDSVSLIPNALRRNWSQPVESPQCLSGKSATLSVLCSGDVNVVLGAVVGGVESYPAAVSHTGAASISSTAFTLPSGATEIRVYIQPQTMNEVVLFAIKLELGSTSTLANDPPANYGEELAKCQRYYQHCDLPQTPMLFGGAYKNTVYFPVPMRATPALTLVPVGGGTTSTIVSNKEGFHWVASDGATYLANYTASADI